MMRTTATRPHILHVANWYPNPWNDVTGNFVRDHIRLFRAEIRGDAVVVEVRYHPRAWLGLRRLDLGDGVRGYYLLTRLNAGKVTEWLSAVMMLTVLLVYRAWRFDALHIHIAYPLAVHARLWRWLIRGPVLISEHWSAYHDNFYLPVNSPALDVIRRPFTFGFSVLAVSETLLKDIQKFALRNDFSSHVILNFVPLHGNTPRRNATPILFAVNNWREIKDPFPMLEGLASAAESGAEFRLVLGGFGDLLKPMREFVASSALVDRTHFPGKMTKTQIKQALAEADANLFSSRYETFSVACAEALGAGVPLIGPHLDAIAEYAGPDDWVQVESRDAAGWADAVTRFVARHTAGEFDGAAIAARAAASFAPETIRARYRDVIAQLLPGRLA